MECELMKERPENAFKLGIWGMKWILVSLQLFLQVYSHDTYLFTTTSYFMPFYESIESNGLIPLWIL